MRVLRLRSGAWVKTHKTGRITNLRLNTLIFIKENYIRIAE
jgi:hypothetical protein